jgi:hypothetical protein
VYSSSSAWWQPPIAVGVIAGQAAELDRNALIVLLLSSLLYAFISRQAVAALAGGVAPAQAH